MSVCLRDKPLGAGVVVALGKGNSVRGGGGRSAAAALQTQQEAQRQTQNQRNHQVALTVRYLQRKEHNIIIVVAVHFTLSYIIKTPRLHTQYITFISALIVLEREKESTRIDRITFTGNDQPRLKPALH